jgi:hypothetical protein
LARQFILNKSQALNSLLIKPHQIRPRGQVTVSVTRDRLNVGSGLIHPLSASINDTDAQSACAPEDATDMLRATF